MWRLGSHSWGRLAIAALAGLLLAFAFPKFSVAGLAWVAPGLLLLAAAGANGRVRFWTGFLGGLVFYLVTLSWLLHIPMAIWPIFGWLALSAYLSLYPAAWVWLCWKLAPVQLPESPPWAWPTLQALHSSSWASRVVWGLQCASAWVALEIVLGRFLSGFPWEFLGVSQYRILPVIQIASITGVYGVSFIIVWFSAALWLGLVGMIRHPAAGRGSWAREMALPFLALTMLIFYGMNQIRREPKPQRWVKLALIQPSIPQTLIWDESADDDRWRALLELSEQALAEKPDILVWPEAAVPNMLRHHDPTARAIVDLVRRHQVWAIVGSDDAAYRPGQADRKVIDYFNSAFVIDPTGQLAGEYRKRQLVIFGEYMPLAKRFPFLAKVSPTGTAGFTAGLAPAFFSLDSLGVRTSVLICFEDVFPHRAREHVRPGTDFLINITNNGWFGESAAQWQHAAAAIFRAVENRLPLVRCANNGLTCWVDASGALHSVSFENGASVYAKGYKIVSVPIARPVQTATAAAATPQPMTFYNRHGDLFGFACVAATAACALLRALRSRRPLAKTSTASHTDPPPQTAP